MGHGFSILLSTADAIKLFGPHLCIYHLASFTKKDRCNRLIFFSMVPPPGDDSPLPHPLLHHHFTNLPPTLDVNASTDKSLAPFAMHFCPYLHHLLQ